MSMNDLTPMQAAKKAEVEAAGGTFVHPSKYRKVKKGAVKGAPHMVAQYQAKKQYKQVYKRIAPETEMVIDQCLDPESAAGNATRWPNTYGKSAVYACKNVINAAFASDNRCAVAVHPRLRNAIYATAGVETTLPIYEADYSFLTASPYLLQDMRVQGPQQVRLSEPMIFNGREVVMPFPHEPTGQLVYPLGIVPDLVNDSQVILFLNFPVAHQDQIRVTVYRYDSSMSLLNQTSYTNNQTDNYVRVAALIHTNGPGTGLNCPSYLAFSVTTNGTPWAGVVNATLETVFQTQNVLAQAVLHNHAQHMYAYDIKDTESIVDTAEKAIVIAQSLLLTAQMSDINNGGALSIARVPGNTQIGSGTGSIDTNSWYEWLASLSTNNYDGAAKSGGYGFYLPDDERGFFYRDVSQFGLLEQLPYLASEFTVADTTEGSIMRIKVSTIVQFTTNSSTYQLAPSPICTELHEIHHLLSLVNACYENDTHKQQLAALLRKLGVRVKKIVKNPENWQKGAAMLASLAAMI